MDRLSAALHEPWFTVRRRHGAIETTGTPHFFRGHTIDADGSEPDGIFARWHWDGARLRVRTDRYGAAPLFYCEHDEGLSVSPSLVALIDEGAPTAIDDSGLALFLRLGFFVGDDTPFRHIRTVPPNGDIVWEAGRVTVTGGCRLLPAQSITRDAALDGFVDGFRRAIARRPPAQRPVVVPLSGGRDSRHILLELCESRHRPDVAVTTSRYPPRSSEDERIAPLLAAAAGVPHRLLPQRDSQVAPEMRKNWETHLCADEHAWFVAMVDQIADVAGTVYDGLGGGLSVPNRFLSAAALEDIAAGRCAALARRLLAALSRIDETFLTHVVRPECRRALSLDAAVDRFARELARHSAAADPIKSFNFWNRIRRELALVPYAMLRGVPTVFTPYLDHELFDFLSSLPPQVMSPTLSPSDKSFHSDAILRGYPRFAHIPFEDKQAAGRDARAHRARFTREAAMYLLPRLTAGPGGVLNRAYVAPRLLYGLARRRYRETASWLAPVALYLFQLDAAANRRHAQTMAA